MTIRDGRERGELRTKLNIWRWPLTKLFFAIEYFCLTEIEYFSHRSVSFGFKRHKLRQAWRYLRVLLNNKIFKTTLLLFFFWLSPKFQPTPFFCPRPILRPMSNFYGPTPKFSGPKPVTPVTNPGTVATNELTIPTQPTLSSRLLLNNINNSAHNVIRRADFSAKNIDFNCSKSDNCGIALA